MPEGMRDFDRGIAPLKSGGGPAVRPVMFAPGPWTFTAPVAGLYAFRLWGPGATGSWTYAATVPGGPSGAYARKTVRLSKGAVVSGVCGRGGLGIKGGSGSGPVAPSSDTTAVFSTGTVTAGRATNPNQGGTGAIGVASGGDVNLNGALGGAAGQSGNPGDGSFPGAVGVASGSGGGGSAPGDEYMAGGRGGNGQYPFSATNQLNYGGWPGGGGGGNGDSSSGYFTNDGGNGLVLITYEGA